MEPIELVQRAIVLAIIISLALLDYSAVHSYG